VKDDTTVNMGTVTAAIWRRANLRDHRRRLSIPQGFEIEFRIRIRLDCKQKGARGALLQW